MDKQEREAAYQELVDHAKVAEHPEYDAAVAMLASLMDVEPFQSAWLLMSTEEKDDVTLTIAEGIGARVSRREREILLKIANQV